MTLIKKILFCFILCIPTHAVFSQQQKPEFLPDQYRATFWTMTEGLSSNITNVMIKDVKGFIWVGSNDNSELNRFDGTEFKKYIHDPNNRTAFNVHGGYILALKEDSLHNIWIGTDKGLSRYDIQADTFTNFNTPIDTAGYGMMSVPFWATRDEMFCIESGTILVSYNIHSLARKRLSIIPKEYNLNSGFASTYGIFEAKTNSIWMLPLGEEGLIQISLSDGKVIRHNRLIYKDPAISGNKGAEGMCYDKRRNCLWLNSHDGLLRFSLEDKQFHHVDALNEYIRLKDYTRYVGIDIDKDGRIWLATHPKGILVYDPETDKVNPVFSDPELIRKTGNFNLHIYCDRDGIIWTSYWQPLGICALLPLSKAVIQYNPKPDRKDSLSNGIILSIVPADKGRIWIGTEDGLNIFDPETEKFEVLREKDLPGIKGTAIIPLVIDTIRRIAWLKAGYEGKLFEQQIFEMDIQTRKCRPIIFRVGTKKLDTLPSNPAEIVPIKNGILVCNDNYGVFEVQAGNLSPRLVVPFDKPYSIDKIILEEDRFLYLKRSDYAISYLNYVHKNGEWVRIPLVLDSMEYITMIYNEKDSTHWVSARNELVHFDNNFQKIKTYRKEDGYTSEFFNMVVDHSGNLWFINNLKKVGRLNMASGKISILSEEDGFNKLDFDEKAPIAKDARGNLYFGTGYRHQEGALGFYHIYPERYTSLKPSIVYLRSLNINQKPFSSSVEVNSIGNLSLAYNQNSIAFVCGIIDFYAKGKDHIRYKLAEAGKEIDWVYPTDYAIRIDGLSPGEYQLVIQASDRSNEFNGPEKIIMIQISPPIWETWWFRILTLGSVGLILYGFFQFRSRNLRRSNALLEEKVMSRTMELKHSLEELRETQTQLIQKEKMASLGELTAGIAHEIQNPLNFVNNFSEVNQELIAELREELVKGNLEEVADMAMQIEDNEGKIFLHGQRASAIVKGMLQHSRTSTGQKEPTDINALADEYLHLSYHGLRAKDKSFHAALDVNFEPGIGQINIIPQDIGRVLLNLYNNAFYSVSEKRKQLPEGYEPVVSVSTKQVDNKVEIRVRDNGIGIPQKVKDKIFQPFFTTKPTGQGTGLGLSLSYDIIKAHGGEIDVLSKESNGAEFIIRLPVV